MKRKGYLIEKISETDNLYLAYYKASRGKQENRSVLEYSKNLNKNIKLLQSQIISGEVSVGNYHYFTIYDPKERKICAAPFHERVLHHALMNVCHPLFEKNMIYDTYATRPGKGIYKALDKAKNAMSQYAYVGKLDFRKYFDSISHSILKQKLNCIFKDPKLLKIFDQIIDSYHVKDGFGIPIGNLTSQYFANYYLSELDHFIKEQLKTPIYIRYMDDILLFDHDKHVLKTKIEMIHHLSKEAFQLTLKPPIINNNQQGVSFLGYRVLHNKILLNGRSKRRFRKKITTYNTNFEAKQWDEKIYRNHVIPLLAFVKHAYTKKYRRQIISELKIG